MCRRVRVVSADNGFHLAERAIDGLIVSRNQRTGTYTLIVQTKVLGVGACNDQLLMHCGERAQAFGIFFQTTGEALVGKVKQRQPAFFYGQLRQMFPLLKRWIDTGWVVAAAVEQHHVTCLRLTQARQQAVKVQRVVCCVVVGVFTHFQTRRVKYALVVRPAWIAYPDTLHRGVFRKEIRRHAQRAGTARGLCRTGTFVTHNCTAFTEQQLLGAATKFRDTINTEVVFGGFVFQQILLSFLNAGQYRSFAGFIFIYTNTQVDFARAVVGTKQIGQAQNRVGRSGGNVLKHDEVPL